MKSYLKFLSRNKLYTAIEAFGLVVSLAFVLIIGSSIRDQLGIVRRTPDHERLFIVGPKTNPNAAEYRMKDALAGLPQFESLASLSFNDAQIEVEGELYVAKFCVADPELLPMLSWKVVAGNIRPVSTANELAITASAARRLFPDKEPLGEQVGFPGDGGGASSFLTITSVIEDPTYSVLADFDFVVNIHSELCPVATEVRESDLRRRGTGMMVFFLGKVFPGTDLVALSQQIEDLPGWMSKYLNMEQQIRNLTSLEDVYYSAESLFVFRQGKRLYLSVLILLGAVLLLSSLLSYINLSLAVSGDRSREMATRRLVGDDRTGIFRKVMGETLLFTFVCFLLAIPLACWLAPLLNNLRPVGLNVAFRIPAEGTYWLMAVGLVLLVALAAGIAPALMSSSFRPIDVVSGKIRRKRKMYFNRISVIIQSALALVLIVMSLLMESQLRYMEKADPGADFRDNLFYCSIPLVGEQQQIISDRLRATPQVLEVGMTTGYPSYVVHFTSGKNMQLAVIRCDSTAFAMMGFRVVDQFAQTSNATFVSQKVANACGISRNQASPADVYWNYEESMRKYVPSVIGGIVEDFRTTPVNYSSPYWTNIDKWGPIVEVCTEEQMKSVAGLLIRTTPDRKAFERWLKPIVRNSYRELTGLHDVFSLEGIRVGYLDDLIAADHDDLRRYTHLVELFCVISILLSLLAMLAMSSYYAGVNAKGIAIRKVFGGTIESETWRGVLTFMGWVCLSILIAVPVSVWLAGRFLQRYPEHLTDYGWIFVVAALVTLLLSFLSVLWQTLKAAKTNPATELKKE